MFFHFVSSTFIELALDFNELEIQKGEYFRIIFLSHIYLSDGRISLIDSLNNRHVCIQSTLSVVYVYFIVPLPGNIAVSLRFSSYLGHCK